MTVLDISGVWNLFMARQFIPGLYRGIYRPLSETAGPEAISQTDDDSFFIGPSSSAKFKSK